MTVTANPTRVRPGWYRTTALLVLSVWATARHTLDRPRLDVRYVVPGRFKVRAVAGGYCTVQVTEGAEPVTIEDERTCEAKTYRTTGEWGWPKSWGPGR